MEVIKSINGRHIFVSDNKRGPGRPRVYAGSEPGAPKITIRFSQDIYDWLKGRGEGVRVYLERLIRVDMGLDKHGSPSSD